MTARLRLAGTASPLYPCFATHSSIQNASPCWRRQQPVTFPSFCMWCWAPAWWCTIGVHALARSKSQTVLSIRDLFSNAFTHILQARSRVSSFIAESFGQRTTRLKTLGFSPSSMTYAAQHYKARLVFKPSRLPALVLVIACRGLLLAGSLIQHREGCTDFLPCWITTCSLFSQQELCLRKDVPTQTAQGSGNMHESLL